MTELWSTDDAAKHFGVSASRARAILAAAGVHRISGYDADAVRNIHRPGQGARTDLKETAVTTTRFQITTRDQYSEREIRHDIPAATWDEATTTAMRAHGEETGVDQVEVQVERLGILDGDGREFHGFTVWEFYSNDANKWMYQVLFDGELPLTDFHCQFDYTGPNENTAKGRARQGNEALARV